MCYFASQGGGNIQVRCKCGAKRSLWSLLDPREQDLWLPRCTFRQQLIVLWCFTRSKSVTQTVEISNLARDSVEQMHRWYVELIAEHQEKANNEMEIGGYGIEVEADEIAFRCKAEKIKMESWE